MAIVFCFYQTYVANLKTLTFNENLFTSNETLSLISHNYHPQYPIISLFAIGTYIIN